MLVQLYRPTGFPFKHFTHTLHGLCRWGVGVAVGVGCTDVVGVGVRVGAGLGTGVITSIGVGAAVGEGGFGGVGVGLWGITQSHQQRSSVKHINSAPPINRLVFLAGGGVGGTLLTPVKRPWLSRSLAI